MLTPQEIEERKNWIGASEVPALFGEHIKLTGTDLWLMKTFPMEHKELYSDSIDIGDTFEDPLSKYAAHKLGVEISNSRRYKFKVCKEHPVLAANLDRRIMLNGKPTDEAIEAKSTSVDDVEFGGKDNEWGEPGTDQVPSRVILQCQSQMLCHGLRRIHVVALLGRMGIKRELFKIERNQTIIDAIIKKAEDFWSRYVVQKIQPPPEEFGLGSIDIIKRVIRQPATWAEVPDEFVVSWEAARKARLAAEKIEEDAEKRMLTPLGDAEGARLSDGRVLCYFPTAKKVLDQKTLKSDYKEIYESLLKDSVSRTPRLKGAKE